MDAETREEFRKVHEEARSFREEMRIFRESAQSQLSRIEETLTEHGERLARMEEVQRGHTEILAGIHKMLANQQARMERLEDAAD